MDPELDEFLDILIQNELQMSRYYEVLVDFVPDHEKTWKMLARQEDVHAKVLKKVCQAIVADPDRFAMGNYTAMAVQTMIRDIAAMIEKIERQEVHPRYAVSFIRDIEDSLLEKRIDEAVKTDVVEIQNLLALLHRQTEEHRNLLRTVEV